MSRERDQLVEAITRQVLAALRERTSAPVAMPQAPSPVPGLAPGSVVHDPATCERCRNWGISGARGPEETRLLAAAGASRVVTTMGYCPGSDGLASLIDHTLLKPDATREEVQQLCREAAQFCFASVCVNPNWVALCRELLRDSGVKVCTVIGFPLGAHLADVKAYETRRAIEQGAEEVDMVINIGALKSRDYALVEQDIHGVVAAANGRAIVKVILETSLLSRDEKVMGCTLSKAAGADYVKTSTGFGGGGATVEDVTLMRETVGPDMGVKASGGVRTREDAERMVAAGATRLGASAGVKIVRGEAAGEGKY
ncbi:MAG: deoxyribose-phosphate aldolase [Candidatus Eisenbacteria bacterium]|jgi:deoxyribose-phosphate aldolase